MPDQKHSTVVVVADDPTYPVGTDEWNATHNPSTPSLATDAVVSRIVQTGASRMTLAGSGRVRVLEPFFPFVGSFAIGTMGLTTDQFMLQYQRVTLAGDARLTLTGTARTIVTDFTPNGRLTLLGRGF